MKDSPTGRVLFLWCLLRLPLVLVLAFLFREDVVRFLEDFTGSLGAFVHPVIFFVCTVLERLCLAAVVIMAFGLLAWGAGRIPRPGLRYAVTTLVGFGLLVLLWRTFMYPSSVKNIDRVVLTTTSLYVTAGIFALNVVPSTWLERLFRKPGSVTPVRALLFVLVGIEALLFRPVLLWFSERVNDSRPRLAQLSRRVGNWLPYVVFVPLMAMVEARRGPLITWFGSPLANDPAVTKFAEGNFNQIALDHKNRRLIATGHGQRRVSSYDLDKLHKKPIRSNKKTGGSQALAFSPLHEEVFVHGADKPHHMTVMDSSTLEVKRHALVPVSPGDPWIVWNPHDDTVVIASEADLPTKKDTAIVDRASGRIRHVLDIDPGNVLLHPELPLLYMSHFRRTPKLMILDLELAKVIHEVPAPDRLTRMAFHDGFLYIGAPLDAEVRKYHGQTLELVDRIPTEFGVRTVAIDHERKLLFAGSLVTNMLDMIDLTNGTSIRRFYLGPWLRTILPDSKNGVAYVSSYTGLYRVEYL